MTTNIIDAKSHRKIECRDDLMFSEGMLLAFPDWGKQLFIVTEVIYFASSMHPAAGANFTQQVYVKEK